MAPFPVAMDLAHESSTPERIADPIVPASALVLKVCIHSREFHIPQPIIARVEPLPGGGMLFGAAILPFESRAMSEERVAVEEDAGSMPKG